MVSLLLVALLLAGCGTPLPVAVVNDGPVAVPEVEVTDDAGLPEARRKRAVKIILVPVPAPTIAKPFPPCESVPGDKRTAILQKLECLKQTADIPVMVKPKP